MYLNIISDTMTQLQRNKTYAMAKGLGTRFFLQDVAVRF